MEAYDFCRKFVDKIEFLCMAEICEEIIKFGKDGEETGIAERALERYDDSINSIRYLHPYTYENWRRAKNRIVWFVTIGTKFSQLGILFKMHIILGSIVSGPEMGRNAAMTDIDEIMWRCIREVVVDEDENEALIEAARYMRRLADNYYSA